MEDEFICVTYASSLYRCAHTGRAAGELEQGSAGCVKGAGRPTNSAFRPLLVTKLAKPRRASSVFNFVRHPKMESLWGVRAKVG